MEVFKTVHGFCFNCMEIHNVQIVRLQETVTYKGVKVEFEPVYEYFSNTGSLLETENLISENNLAMKEAYEGIRNLRTQGD